MRYLHTLTHRLRCWLSPAYADAAALARDADTQEFLREFRTNDWALTLRELGHDVPVGSLLFGVPVTR